MKSSKLCSPDAELSIWFSAKTIFFPKHNLILFCRHLSFVFALCRQSQSGSTQASLKSLFDLKQKNEFWEKSVASVFHLIFYCLVFFFVLRRFFYSARWWTFNYLWIVWVTCKISSLKYRGVSSVRPHQTSTLLCVVSLHQVLIIGLLNKTTWTWYVLPLMLLFFLKLWRCSPHGIFNTIIEAKCVHNNFHSMNSTEAFLCAKK